MPSRPLWPTLLRLLAILAMLSSGLQAARAAEPSPKRTAGMSDAAAIYHNYCSVCHGDNGDGRSRAQGSLKPPPRDFTTAQSLSELTRERMLAAVKGGVPGTAMVGWASQLNDRQVESVVDYVRDTFMRASTTADASPGRRIFAKSCSVCHGDRGQGSMWATANLRPAPRDFTSAEARQELTRERMLASVAAGRPGTAMAGFATQLKREEMEQVVDYVRSAFMRVGHDAAISGTQAHGGSAPGGATGGTGNAASAMAAASVDMSVPMPGGLAGDARAGRRFYDANCATCHGVKGDGKGPRAYFINPKPRNFVAPESRAQFNRPAIYVAVAAGKLGTEMPAWDKVLDRQQIADVAEYVFQAFMQPERSAAARGGAAPRKAP